MTADVSLRTPPPSAGLEAPVRTAFLVVDTESVPDGNLIAAARYPGEDLTADEAVDKYAAELRAASPTGSDFVPVTFQIPVAVCVLRVGADFSLQAMTCLDAPHYRPREIVRKFWIGVGVYKAKLVTFNGRGFDVPLLELAAFRYGFSARDHYLARDRYRGPLDLMEWFSNFGGVRVTGGLNLLAKLIGKPGKMDVAGDQVLRLHRGRKFAEINDYCLCDTLDTYFVFLRTRVLTGDIPADREAELVDQARCLLEAKTADVPALRRYLDEWK